MLPANEVLLLIEDDDNDVVLIQRALKKANFLGTVKLAHDGQEALDYFQGIGQFSDRDKFPLPTLIITDLKLPKRNGFEILQWLGAEPNRRVFPTLVFSSSPTEEDVKKAYQLGANSYLVKPADFEMLQRLIADVLYYWSICRRPLPGARPNQPLP